MDFAPEEQDVYSFNPSNLFAPEERHVRDSERQWRSYGAQIFLGFDAINMLLLRSKAPHLMRNVVPMINH